MNAGGDIFIIIIMKKKISLLTLASNYHFYENCILFYSCQKICLSIVSLHVLL